MEKIKNIIEKQKLRELITTKSVPLFSDDLMLYIENPRAATQKLLELTIEFGKVAEYEVNIQKDLTFLYTNNKRSEIKIKEMISFTIISKRINYLGINVTKKVNELHSKNYKPLVKEIEYNTNNWKDTP